MPGLLRQTPLERPLCSSMDRMDRCPCRKLNLAGNGYRIGRCSCLMRELCSLIWLALVALAIVKPETVIKWHRAGFRLYWRCKSKARGGRPTVPLEIRKLVREMSIANASVGSASDPWRVAQDRHRNRADECGQVHGQATRPAVSRLEDIPSQSRGWDRCDGYVCRADNLVSPALWIADHGARPATYSVVWRHSASNR